MSDWTCSSYITGNFWEGRKIKSDLHVTYELGIIWNCWVDRKIAKPIYEKMNTVPKTVARVAKQIHTLELAREELFLFLDQVAGISMYIYHHWVRIELILQCRIKIKSWKPSTVGTAEKKGGGGGRRVVLRKEGFICKVCQYERKLALPYQEIDCNFLERKAAWANY